MTLILRCGVSASSFDNSVIYQVFLNKKDELKHHSGIIIKLETLKRLRLSTGATWGYSDIVEVYNNRSYIYLMFTTEIDYLAFTLWADLDSSKCSMWPKSLRFTVYEQTEDPPK